MWARLSRPRTWASTSCCPSDSTSVRHKWPSACLFASDDQHRVLLSLEVDILTAAPWYVIVALLTGGGLDALNAVLVVVATPILPRGDRLVTIAPGPKPIIGTGPPIFTGPKPPPIGGTAGTPGTVIDGGGGSGLAGGGAGSTGG